MGKNDYLDALKKAMAGIDADSQARTLAYYEQRFIDGLAAGRSEEEIYADLDEPKKIAMTLRANSHKEAFVQKKTPANFARMFVSLIGLIIFNMFMVVPAMVYFSLLATMYACSLAFYLGGVAVTASGLAGANELVIDGPLRRLNEREQVWDNDSALQTKVSISNEGIQVYQEKPTDDVLEATKAAARASKEALKSSQQAIEHSQKATEEAMRLSGMSIRDAARASEAATREAANALRDAASNIDDDDEAANRSERVIRRAESVAGRGVRISTDLDAGSRTTQTILGLGMVIGAILLFLLSLVVTKYTLVGIRRYFDMNLSLLKGR